MRCFDFNSLPLLPPPVVPRQEVSKTGTLKNWSLKNLTSRFQKSAPASPDAKTEDAKEETKTEGEDKTEDKSEETVAKTEEVSDHALVRARDETRLGLSRLVMRCCWQIWQSLKDRYKRYLQPFYRTFHGSSFSKGYVRVLLCMISFLLILLDILSSSVGLYF